MFPQVNKIFRKKNQAEIATLKISKTNTHILDSYNIKYINWNKDKHNNIIVNETSDKLNTIGAFFANVSNNQAPGKPKFTELVNKRTNLYKSTTKNDIEAHSTLFTFNENNTASQADYITISQTQLF